MHMEIGIWAVENTSEMQRKLLPTIDRITTESVASEGLKLEENLGRWDGYPIDCMHIHSHTRGPSMPTEQRGF